MGKTWTVMALALSLWGVRASAQLFPGDPMNPLNIAIQTAMSDQNRQGQIQRARTIEESVNHRSFLDGQTSAQDVLKILNLDKDAFVRFTLKNRASDHYLEVGFGRLWATGVRTFSAIEREKNFMEIDHGSITMPALIFADNCGRAGGNGKIKLTVRKMRSACRWLLGDAEGDSIDLNCFDAIRGLSNDLFDVSVIKPTK